MDFTLNIVAINLSRQVYTNNSVKKHRSRQNKWKGKKKDKEKITNKNTTEKYTLQSYNLTMMGF